MLITFYQMVYNSSYASPAINDFELPEIENKPLKELYDSIKGDTIFEKFKTCSDCNCCERHQKNRPVCIYIPYRDSREVSGQDEQECTCTCRHSLRHLNRIYNSTVPVRKEPRLEEDEM